MAKQVIWRVKRVPYSPDCNNPSPDTEEWLYQERGQPDQWVTNSTCATAFPDQTAAESQIHAQPVENFEWEAVRRFQD